MTVSKPHPHEEPDPPLGFGYKTSWYAIKAENLQAVADALGLSDLRPSTWAAGIQAAYDRSVFVTPPIAGWVLATGFWLGGGSDENFFGLMRQLSARFGEAQYFQTHRVVEQHNWVRAVDGSLLRAYSYCGDTGEVHWDLGVPQPGESELGPDAFPDEQVVMRLASLWSIDPTKLGEMGLPPSLGLVGRPANRAA